MQASALAFVHPLLCSGLGWGVLQRCFPGRAAGDGALVQADALLVMCTALYTASYVHCSALGAALWSGCFCCSFIVQAGSRAAELCVQGVLHLLCTLFFFKSSTGRFCCSIIVKAGSRAAELCVQGEWELFGAWQPAVLVHLGQKGGARIGAPPCQPPHAVISPKCHQNNEVI